MTNDQKAQGRIEKQMIATAKISVRQSWKVFVENEIKLVRFIHFYLQISVMISFASKFVHLASRRSR